MSGTRVEQHLKAAGGRPVPGARAALLAALALVLVAAVGLGATRPVWDVEGPPGLVGPDSYAGDLIVVCFGLLAVAPLVASAIRGRRRGRRTADIEPDLPPVRRAWWMRVVELLAVTATVFVCLRALSLLPDGGSGRTKKVPGPHHGGAGTPPATPADGRFPPTHWWGFALLALVLVAGAATAWRLRDAPGGREVDADEPDDLLEAVDLSLEDLEREPDPRLAVIRAYARMERALGLHGLARAASETPLEYLARALASLRVGRSSVERLTALFERAKFSQHEIDGSMKSEALAALAALRDELAEAAA